KANNTLPSYIKIGDTICLNCYNGIVTKSSIKFQQHVQATERSEVESGPSEAIGTVVIGNERSGVSETESINCMQQSEIDEADENTDHLDPIVIKEILVKSLIRMKKS
ncbi:3242_t:CDS:2, partial [Scutellospora calospora]